MSLIRCNQTTLNVLSEVAAEHVRNEAKWGVQDHPSIAPEAEAMGPFSRADHYGVAPEGTAKRNCEIRFANGVGAYADILAEEVSEAICAPDDEARRAELVQVAAVAVAMIEAIDRRAGRALDSVSMDVPA